MKQNIFKYTTAILLTVLLSLGLTSKVNAQSYFCDGDSVCVTLNAVSGSIQWESSPDMTIWTPVPGATNDTLCVLVDTATYYRAEVTDAACDPVWSDTIQVIPVNVIADAGADITTCLNDSAMIGGSPTASGGVPPYTYSWTPTTGLSSATAANPMAIAATLTYVVTVTDSIGCMDTDTVQMTDGAGAPGTQTFIYTGAPQPFIVPFCVDTISIEAWGAQGGTATNNSGCLIGGEGGYAYGKLPVTPGDTIWIYVGGQGMPGDVGGWNGGGSACSYTATCSRGGGASDVRVGGITFNDRVIVAAGGGGAEWSGCVGTGGNGGGLTGNAGSSSTSGGTYNGLGGTPTAGGAAGAGSGGAGGLPGSLGNGGTSGDYPGSGHAGSGGGGYYGGGGGGADGHGGGGSSFIGGVVAPSGTTTGGRLNDGNVVFTW